MHERPGHAWSAESLASAVGLSRTRFYERFTTVRGEPPVRYLARFRVTAAADLMLTGGLSTPELAQSVGYASEDAFARAFKRWVGQTPAEFRRARAPQAGAEVGPGW
jgi:AraC-like DNA-binding protein